MSSPIVLVNGKTNQLGPSGTLHVNNIRNLHTGLMTITSESFSVEVIGSVANQGSSEPMKVTEAYSILEGISTQVESKLEADKGLATNPHTSHKYDLFPGSGFSRHFIETYCEDRGTGAKTSIVTVSSAPSLSAVSIFTDGTTCGYFSADSTTLTSGSSSILISPNLVRISSTNLEVVANGSTIRWNESTIPFLPTPYQSVVGALDGINTVAVNATASINNHINSTADAHDASAISFVPTGTIASNNAQDAIEEVATDAATALAGHVGTGGASHAAVTTSVNGFMLATDKVKLDGIEALADVTDAANVAAAGAIMTGSTAGGDLGGTYPNPTLSSTITALINSLIPSPWTPTGVSTSGITSYTFIRSFVKNVNGYVTLESSISVVPTASGSCLIRMDVPITISPTEEVGGVASCTSMSLGAPVPASCVTTDEDVFVFIDAADADQHIVSFIITYEQL